MLVKQHMWEAGQEEALLDANATASVFCRHSELAGAGNVYEHAIHTVSMVAN